MVRVMKSPNMISTPGRLPDIAAPTAIPVNPASEIGVSSTRSLPNSSTSPESTLNGVPASATSSPMMQMFGSRRISSASASRIAWAKVRSRTPVSGIDILLHFVAARIRRRDREFHRLVHQGSKLASDLRELPVIGQLLGQHPIGKVLDGIALGFPFLFFLLRPVVFAIDVTHVVP